MLYNIVKIWCREFKWIPRMLTHEQTAATVKADVKVIEYPSYSPDLAPGDYRLFPSTNSL